jgi:hypothetical protein
MLSVPQLMHIHLELFGLVLMNIMLHAHWGLYVITDHTLNGRHQSCLRRLDSLVSRVVYD